MSTDEIQVREATPTLLTQNQRKEWARDFAKIAQVDAANADQGNAGFERDSRFDNKYGRVGEQLFREFVGKAALLDDPRYLERADRVVTLHGSYVLTRLLSYGPSAYGNYAQNDPGHNPSVESLSAVMKRGHEVLKLLANRDGSANTTLEVTFGLLQYPPMYDSPAPFLVEPDANGKPEFKASPVILQKAAIELHGRGISLRSDPARIYCPAVGTTLKSLWDRGIEIASTDPNLFAADLNDLLEYGLDAADASRG